jgi:hypothetical protein
VEHQPYRRELRLWGQSYRSGNQGTVGWKTWLTAFFWALFILSMDEASALAIVAHGVADMLDVLLLFSGYTLPCGSACGFRGDGAIAKLTIH